MNGKILLLPLLLFAVGCSLCADPLFQTAALAGDPAGLEAFAGQWYDENGNLIATVSGPPAPRLSIRTPYGLEPQGARLGNGEIVFHLTSDNPTEISLQLTGKDQLQVSVAREASVSLAASSCSCTEDRVPAVVLVRNPKAAWLAGQSVRKTTEQAAIFARAAYESTWDWLARVV